MIITTVITLLLAPLFSRYGSSAKNAKLVEQLPQLYHFDVLIIVIWTTVFPQEDTGSNGLSKYASAVRKVIARYFYPNQTSGVYQGSIGYNLTNLENI